MNKKLKLFIKELSKYEKFINILLKIISIIINIIFKQCNGKYSILLKIQGSPKVLSLKEIRDCARLAEWIVKLA